MQNNAAVQALIGHKEQSQTATYYKAYPVVVPESEKAPYIAVRLVGKVPGGKNCDFNYTIQVASFANSYDAVTALNNAVITALQDQAAGTVNGQAFGYLNLTNEADDYVREHNLFSKITTFEGMAD